MPSPKDTVYSCATTKFGLGARRAESLKESVSPWKQTGEVTVLYHCTQFSTRWCPGRELSLEANHNQVRRKGSSLKLYHMSRAPTPQSPQ